MGQHYNQHHTGSFYGLINQLFGSEVEYYTPYKNYKKYYQETVFFQTVINTIAETTASVEFKEVYKDGVEVENSEYVEFLNNPNKLTDKQGFVKEYTISTLVNGIGVVWGTYFNDGKLNKTDRELHVIEPFNLQYPKLDNSFWSMPKYSVDNLMLRLNLDNSYRDIPLKELIIIYDTIKNGIYSGSNSDTPSFNREQFLNPISRVDALKYDLQIIKTTQDGLAYFSSKPVGGILSKNTPSGLNAGAYLENVQKAVQESKINGKDEYGASLGTKGHIITTHEDLKYLSIYTDTDKIINALISMQNNSKQNVRTAYGIPSDILEARSGKSKGSTFENQNIAEARFVSGICKNIVDKLCLNLTNKTPLYFNKRGTKLTASFDHLPSIIKGMKIEKQQGIKFQTEALNSLFDANAKAKDQGYTLSIDRYLKENGFEDLI
ncbi:hypothetical protein [uncultured Mediterranean phage uvMED]|nr:hypothetical protein [uncultured Mediterranean phage uvMED]